MAFHTYITHMHHSPKQDKKDTLMNHLKLTFVSLWLAFRLNIEGWRYPTVTHTYDGRRFRYQGDLVKMVIFNLIKYHQLHKLFFRLNTNIAIKAAVLDHEVRISVYPLLVASNSNDHLDRPANGVPGATGTFYYLYAKGQLINSTPAITGKQQYRYNDSDPVFSFTIPHTRSMERQLQHIAEIEGYIPEPAPVESKRFLTVVKGLVS